MRARYAAIIAFAAFILAMTYLAPPFEGFELGGFRFEFEGFRGLGLIALTFLCFLEAMFGRQAASTALADLKAAKAEAERALKNLQSDASQARASASTEVQRVTEAAHLQLMRAEEAARAEAVQLAAAQAQVSAAAAQAAEARADAARAHAAVVKLENELRVERLKTPEREVVNLLALLQSRGRLVDFLMDDITKYGDAQVGAAARVVHQGCASVVSEYFDIKPVSADAEGSRLTLEKDFDTQRVRLLGKVLGEPPFHGRLLHRGWQTVSVHLPQTQTAASGQPGLIAPAEVELN